MKNKTSESASYLHSIVTYSIVSSYRKGTYNALPVTIILLHFLRKLFLCT